MICSDDIRVEGCLGGSLAWSSEGNDLLGQGTTSWHSSMHMRMRRSAEPDSLTWEYMRYCEPWPVRANILDTLRIVRRSDGRFVEARAVPYRTGDWNVAGVRTTRRPLLVEDTIPIKARSLPREARSGCLSVYRTHTFTVLILRTADEGPAHRYAWTAETGLLYMIVPDSPDDDEVQRILQQKSNNACFKQLQPSGDGRAALVEALSERARAFTR
ncbi:MAG: hypothetical protein JNL05_02585 [Flavobacteriales bacterium]|nr:hypothetical protein [Flavobacteriales bacterium]